MSGLLVLIIFGIWCVIGWNVCGSLVVRRVQRPLLRWTLFPIFWVVWFVGPFADAIIGRRIFEAECARLPEVRYFGPVHIGAGAFFDENGTRRWNNDREFWELQEKTGDWWERVFVRQHDETRVLTFPVVIKRTETMMYHMPSNTPMLTYTSLSSSGGWIDRALASVLSSNWECLSPGRWPRTEDTIIF